MRALKAIIALLFVLAGIVLGALNQHVVAIDLFFARYQARVGLILLLCILGGAIIGGALVSVGLLASKASPRKADSARSDGGKLQ
jgi:lipopolysaccharide assembly protein A